MHNKHSELFRSYFLLVYFLWSRLKIHLIRLNFKFKIIVEKLSIWNITASCYVENGVFWLDEFSLLLGIQNNNILWCRLIPFVILLCTIWDIVNKTHMMFVYSLNDELFVFVYTQFQQYWLGDSQNNRGWK